MVGATYVVALFITILDSTIVGVALPAMAEDFQVPTASIGWVSVGYLVSMAVWIPASGWLGDRFGTKRILLVALVVFTSASILCGLSRSLEQLILFRLIQGGSAGMVSPVGTAMLFRAFPPERRARAAGILIVPTSLAPALGPLLGGLLVLGIANFAIWQKEDVLANGRTILLELAPVDPRSLMQGDYMALRFRLAADVGASMVVTPVTRRTSSSPGLGQRSASRTPGSVATRGSVGSRRPTSMSCARTSTGPLVVRTPSARAMVIACPSARS